MIPENAHALAIGISRYQHVASLPEVKDAEDVAAILAAPLHGAYRAEHVTLLVDEAATRTAILDAIARLATRAGPSSTVLLYFSGHGGQIIGADGRPECYLIPVDTTGSRPGDLTPRSPAASCPSACARSVRRA
jgi:uncharacterized caspase-like protein